MYPIRLCLFGLSSQGYRTRVLAVLIKSHMWSPEYQIITPGALN